MTDVKHVQIDRRRVVHYICVMLTSKDVTSATHVGCKLINFIKAAVDDGATKALVPQVANHKIIRFGFREFVKFQVHAAHPEPVMLEPFDQMATDESSGPTDQRTPRHRVLSFCPEAPLGSSNGARGPALGHLEADPDC